MTFYQVAFLFFTYSFLGWVGEVVFTAAVRRKYQDRGVLSGPLCLLYGVGGLVITFALGAAASSLSHRVGPLGFLLGVISFLALPLPFIIFVLLCLTRLNFFCIRLIISDIASPQSLYIGFILNAPARLFNGKTCFICICLQNK